MNDASLVLDKQGFDRVLSRSVRPLSSRVFECEQVLVLRKVDQCNLFHRIRAAASLSNATFGW